MPAPTTTSSSRSRSRSCSRGCGRSCAEPLPPTTATCSASPTSSSIPATREVRRGGDPIELTRTEFSLLELFLLNPRQVLTRSIIFERVWGYDFGFGSNSLDVYIGYLRRKTEQGGKPRLIQTIRGVGYALRERRVSYPRTPHRSRSPLAVAVAVAATSAITYVLVRNELRGQVDDALRERVSDVAPAASSSIR